DRHEDERGDSRLRELQQVRGSDPRRRFYHTYSLVTTTTRTTARGSGAMARIFSRFGSKRRCMKYSATSSAFHAAMPISTAMMTPFDQGRNATNSSMPVRTASM